MVCHLPWDDAKSYWRPFLRKFLEEQRLRKFFRRLEQEIPNPPKGWEEVAKPCKWKKILEEKAKI